MDVAETVGGDRSSRIPTSAATFRDWKAGTASFDRMALTAPYQTLVSTDGDEAVQAARELRDLRLPRPARRALPLGRGILPEEDGAPGEHAVAVLSRGAWERVFGADPDAVGRTAMLSGTLYTVVGVLDASFVDLNAGAVPTDVFVPAGMIVQINGAQSWERRAARSFQIVARLAEGCSIEQARSEIEAVMQGLQREDPGTLGDSGVMLTPLRDQLLGTLDAPLLALLTGAVFLLLVGCINVASLMLVRGAARAREMAVRLALGAARGRLVRQLTTEALILAFVGGALGIALAYGTLGFLLDLSGGNLPSWVHVRLDPAVLGASLLLAAATGLAFGLLPALRSTRADLRTALTRGDARSGGGPSGKGRHALVVVEVASAMILMVGSGLMIRSFQELAGTDMGFSTERVLTANVSLPTLGYETGEAVQAFDQRLLERLRATPGVRFAHVWGPGIPGATGNYTTILPVGREVRSQLDADLMRVHNVSPGALEDLGLTLLEGRTLTADDREGSTRAIVISQGLAETLFPGEDPLGKQVNNFIPPGFDPRPSSRGRSWAWSRTP